MHNTLAVIFDLGRVCVTIDTTRPKFAAMMNMMGIPPETAVQKYWFAREVRQHMTGEMSSRDFYRVVRERFNLSLEYPAFVEAWCDLFELMPGMQTLFEQVAERYTVGILSDTDPLHWEYILKMAPWLGKVVTPTLSYEVGYLKPHPAMFSQAAADCGCTKEECLFVDDQEHYVDGARYYGMPALPFTGADKLRRDLAGLGILDR